MTHYSLGKDDVFVRIDAKDFLVNGGFSEKQADAIIKVVAGVQQGILDRELGLLILTKDKAFQEEQARSLMDYFSRELAA